MREFVAHVKNHKGHDDTKKVEAVDKSHAILMISNMWDVSVIIDIYEN